MWSRHNVVQMQYEDLNGHFKERIRARVEAKLHEADNAKANGVDPVIRDYVVGVIILLADENNLVKAAAKLYDIKQQNPETAGSFEDALLAVTEVQARFATEVSILADLYQMQEHQVDIMEIIVQTELRLCEKE